MQSRKPNIISAQALAPNEWQLVLDIQPTLFWFQGHFPEAPILPGVVQLTWAREQALSLWPESRNWLSRLAGMEAVKFQQVIRPGDTVRLTLTLDEARKRLGFSYVCAQNNAKKFASGRMVPAQ
ncbi:hypothetical protein L1F30_04045 [Simiduia sp. 21SJ11W-1]|uniref:3-hydroxyacyl-ACP dehydratase FabZ family protein n=1 Tax=Simiduia sp. 21SJ11W-1 TaxID=2909669 RepID=UPI0020A114A6|nr:hypothetical protein [Simiduia sp. 21SJ11W-1]UTA48719.1 hypothetical protein L1F30_04045 [Simiduia sp. 21SJ11W-1]